ncbi:sensor histidine kinase [Haloglycomyces albus]|uniref:sensor histidine kinase n=1 Tax=Haloglycomyces albus TaxID=526067 RepID=UPI001B7FB772|nr:sensor histidine kinase [Haloglycomyces albus]
MFTKKFQHSRQVPQLWKLLQQLNSALAHGLNDSAARFLGRSLQADALALTDYTQLQGLWGDIPVDVVDRLRHRCLSELSPVTHESHCAAPIVHNDALLGCVIARGPVTTTSVVAAADLVATRLDHLELARARHTIAAANLRTLRAEISPHFLHNTLSTIIGNIPTDPERARDLLTSFSDYLRYSFAAKGNLATIGEELEAVEMYVELQQARFGERLDFQLQLEPDILPVPIPFLVVQPLVENAIRHGLESGSVPGTVVVRGLGQGPVCCVEVEDDGVGMDPVAAERILADGPEAGRGIGLANVDERLRSTYGPEFGLVVETAVGEGVKATVRLPRFPRGFEAAEWSVGV